jgi:DNA topoisomerase-1
VKHFAPIVDYDFTSEVEQEFDEIAEGKKQWNKMIAEFYKREFHPLIEASESVSREETSQMRKLGDDPKTGEPVYARFGRYGPMLQRGDTKDEEEKPDFAPMPDDAALDTVTLEGALKMFELPKKVGKTEAGEEITANIGRFGPYIQVGKTFVSIKDTSPFKITEDEAREKITEKLQQIAERNINDFGKIKVLKGPYGPYATDGKKNAKIPKEQDPKKLTETQAKKLLDEAPAKGKGRRFPRRKKA